MITHRIYGPPGTGKTTYLTDYTADAAAAVGGAKVMVCSFTTAAAAEVSARALAIPEDNVGTLHRFCYHATGKPPVLEEKKKAIEEWNTFAPAYRMSPPGCRDINSGLEYNDADTLGDTLLGQTTVLRNRLIPIEAWPHNARVFHETWTMFKNAQGGIDYTDMIELALRDCSTAPGDPAVICVDEAQDCTPLQFALLQKWAAKTDRLIMVGDDDQCIYQFAGATPRAFAAHEIGPDDVLLAQSHRVPHATHAHATAWIAQALDRVQKPYLPTGEPGFIKRPPLTFKQGKELAELATTLMGRFTSCMFIASCSYMVDPLKRALAEAGIPFHNPYRLIRADWNPLRLTKGTTFAQRARAFLSPDIEHKDWWTPTEFRDWATPLTAKGNFIRGRKADLEAHPPERVNADVLLSYLTEEAVTRALHMDLEWWAGQLHEDDKRKAAYPLAVCRNFGAAFLDANEIPPSVIVGTIHSVKGGEADVVIIAPDLSQMGMAEWTGKGRNAIRRLFYVAITRARYGAFILRPATPSQCGI